MRALRSEKEVGSKSRASKGAMAEKSSMIDSYFNPCNIHPVEKSREFFVNKEGLSTELVGSSRCMLFGTKFSSRGSCWIGAVCAVTEPIISKLKTSERTVFMVLR